MKSRDALLSIHESESQCLFDRRMEDKLVQFQKPKYLQLNFEGVDGWVGGWVGRDGGGVCGVC